MKCIDAVKPPASTELEAWYRWLNWTQTRLLTMAMFTDRKQIKVVCANEQDWQFVFLKHNGKKVMAVF